MKRLFFIALITILVFTAASAAWYTSKLHRTGRPVSHAPAAVIDNAAKEKLNKVTVSARKFATANKFNTQFCFLIDMSMPSGSPRFSVYDLDKDIVAVRGLVTHGRCNQDWLIGRKYGNVIGCGCTSLGKYKVGNPYQGRFGLAYKLFGLDTTNSNAYSRFVVLHSMQCVPEAAVDPYPICQSDGCPTVSPGFLKELSVIINRSHQPVLLWIYE